MHFRRARARVRPLLAYLVKSLRNSGGGNRVTDFIIDGLYHQIKELVDCVLPVLEGIMKTNSFLPENAMELKRGAARSVPCSGIDFLFPRTL